MKKILVIGSSEYRIKSPYSNLKCEGIEFVFEKGETRLWDTLDYDGFIIHQPTIDISVEYIQEYRDKGKIFVVDVDDDLTVLPFQNPVFKDMQEEDRLRCYRSSLRCCDYIHVSTPELKESLRQVKKTEVFLNAIDFTKYDVRSEDVRDGFRNTYNIPKENKIVAWFGSHTHHADLGLVFPLIHELFKRKNITVVLCSNLKWLRALGFRSEHFPNLITLDYLPFEIYKNTLAIADVSLAPLVDNKFNQCKSEVKALEFSVHGVPTVASDVAPYRRFAGVSSTDHLLTVKKERLDLWVKEVDAALGFVGKTVGENAKKVVEHSYDLKDINKLREQWWMKVLSPKKQELKSS